MGRFFILFYFIYVKEIWGSGKFYRTCGNFFFIFERVLTYVVHF